MYFEVWDRQELPIQSQPEAIPTERLNSYRPRQLLTGWHIYWYGGRVMSTNILAISLKSGLTLQNIPVVWERISWPVVSL